MIRRGDVAYPQRIERCLGLDAPDQLIAYGETGVARLPLLAIFASIRTPASLVLKGLDAARTFRAAAISVVGGFQSPLEHEMLRLLLRGSQPLAVCSARRIEGMRIPRSWRPALTSHRMLILGAGGIRWRRATVRTAAYRNRLVSALAESIFVVHAHPGSRTFRTVAEALEWGRTVYCFEHSGNRDLQLLGAQPVADLASFPAVLHEARSRRC